MTKAPDNESWAITMLDMAYTPKLDQENQERSVQQILDYFQTADSNGVPLEFAREKLHHMFLDIMPVIEPLPRVLKRTLRDLGVR